jgi:hypothetical protein
MRRVLALPLLALFSFWLIVPALVSSEDSRLPECCRRDGRHRCEQPQRLAESGSGCGLRDGRERL